MNGQLQQTVLNWFSCNKDLWLTLMSIESFLFILQQSKYLTDDELCQLQPIPITLLSVSAFIFCVIQQETKA